jgi:GNAT superfamily N-acetyltransferase
LTDFRIIFKVNPKKNPALAHCQVKFWLAVKDDKVVGRVAGIVHKDEAEKTKKARFGWIDFEDDSKISQSLIEEVEKWGRSLGMEYLHGPLGFSDMDFEGMLVDGFDFPSTIATIYNYPYYPKHLESLGYTKSVDWLEMRSQVPEKINERLLKRVQHVEKRFGLRSAKLTSKKDALKYADELFDVLNKGYADLYGFHELTEAEIKYYIDQYLGFVIPELLSFVLNKEGKLVGFAITMPSLSKAFQKAKGRLLPLGAFHILRALRKNDTVDMYLIGVLPEYQRKGVTSLIFRDLIQAYQRRGIKWAITNPMLEENSHILSQFNEYQERSEFHKRRRCYQKKL